MTEPLSIVFAGTPAFGLPALEALNESSHQLKAVYTQPDRPAGRGQKLQFSPIKQWAVAHGLPVYQPLNFKSEEAVNELATLQPDVMVVIAYGLILPRTVLTIPRYGCINVHASLLPRWRGASPIQHAILHGDQHSGVTIMQMAAGMDTGDMLAKVSCVIGKQDTAGDLHDRLAELAVPSLLDVLAQLKQGTLQPEVQNSEQVTYAAKLTKEQAKIDWHQSTETIHNQIRAYFPWPIAHTHCGEELIRIHRAHVENRTSTAAPGTIIDISKHGVLVATQTATLCIEHWQFAGGKVLSIADWMHAGRAPSYLGQILG